MSLEEKEESRIYVVSYYIYSVCVYVIKECDYTLPTCEAKTVERKFKRAARGCMKKPKGKKLPASGRITREKAT